MVTEVESHRMILVGDGRTRAKLPYADTVPHERTATDALYELHWNYDLDVHVQIDQWMRVVAESWRDPKFGVMVECDSFEDGLFAIVKWCRTNRQSTGEIEVQS